MKNLTETIESWFEEADSSLNRLTDWERKFTQEVGEWFDKTGHISDRQEEVLQRIHEKLEKTSIRSGRR